VVSRVPEQASVTSEKIITHTLESGFRRSVENLDEVFETTRSDLMHVLKERN
jgi:hypothetical protein